MPTLLSWVPFAVIVLISTAALAQDSEATLIQRGQQALRAEQFAGAAEIFQSAVQRFPASKPAYSGLLLSCLKSKRAADAIRVGKQAVERWPQDAEFAHYLGLAFMQSGDLRQAMPHLRRATTLAPRDFDSHYDLALAFLEQNQYGPAA